MIGVKGNLANSFPIQFTVKNTSDRKIKSGMLGEVILKEEEGPKQIIIPATAVINAELQPQVYLIKEGTAVLQNIIIQKRIQNRLILKSGLKEGDVIITGGFVNLFEGANVVAN